MTYFYLTHNGEPVHIGAMHWTVPSSSNWTTGTHDVTHFGEKQRALKALGELRRFLTPKAAARFGLRRVTRRLTGPAAREGR